jgi:serine/threonine-protein kinase
MTVISHQLATPTPSFEKFAPAVKVPAALESIVLRLTAKEPEQRPASATALLAELTEELEHAASHPPAIASAPPPVQATDRPAKPAEPAALSAPSQSAAERGTADPLASLRPLLARLPAPLRKTPSLLLVPLALLGLLLFILVRSSGPADRSGGTNRTPRVVPASALASDPQIDKALAAGPSALLELAKEFPQDARIKRKIAHVYMAQLNGLDALRWLALAMALDDSLVVDGEVLQAARMAAVKSESLDASIAILEKDFGARGVDVLYALATGPSPHRTKSRYAESLVRPEVRARASAAASIAIGLRAESSCAAKRDLLSRAAQEGDGRALEQLKMLTQKHNCGRYGLIDCWACLRKDSALDDAIAAIAARSARH